MRVGEILAINIYDFQNSKFEKLRVIFEKSHIQDEYPILKEFNQLVKEYVLKNKHLMKNGYLFPYGSKKVSNHMTTESAGALMCKMRHIIGKEHRAFLDHTLWQDKTGITHKRYRIGWHSCRRWFETKLWKQYKDKMLIRDVMRYSESRVVDVYIDSYETWQKEQEILQNTFSDIFDHFQNTTKGQTKLTEFA